MHEVPFIERRAAVRYKLRLPVVFQWTDGAEHTEGGFTRDVATGGAFILNSKCPPIGHDLRIEILLPSPDQSDIEMKIKCVGKVTRIVEEAGCVGFGVQGTFEDGHLARQISVRPEITEITQEAIQMRRVQIN